MENGNGTENKMENKMDEMKKRLFLYLMIQNLNITNAVKTYLVGNNDSP